MYRVYKVLALFLFYYRWGFITHGGIDGYSRLVTFLKCSTKNDPITVLDAFVEALNTYGVPCKVRSDRGMTLVFKPLNLFLSTGSIICLHELDIIN